jgi:hypothetical protein
LTFEGVHQQRLQQLVPLVAALCSAAAGLLDILQGPHLCTSLQLNAVICLVSCLLLLLHLT